MYNLKRIKVGQFELKDSITLDELEENKENLNYIKSKMISIEDIFENNQGIVLNDRKIELFFNGVNITLEKPNGIYKIYDESRKFIGTGELKEHKLKRDVII